MANLKQELEFIEKNPGMYFETGVERCKEKVIEAINKDEDNFVELIGKLNGLQMLGDIHISDINNLLKEYQNKRFKVLGDFN